MFLRRLSCDKIYRVCKHINSSRWSVTSWWRHQMETFSALLAICAGNSPVPGEFPAQRPVTRSFDVFFDLRLNKRLSKQPWGWWFETPVWSLWRHRNVFAPVNKVIRVVGQPTIQYLNRWFLIERTRNVVMLRRHDTIIPDNKVQGANMGPT